MTVGRDAKVGANTVVIEDVPPQTTVVGNPGHPVRVEGRPVEGPDTDWIHLPDPIAEAIKELSERISELEAAARGADRRGRRGPQTSPSCIPRRARARPAAERSTPRTD